MAMHHTRVLSKVFQHRVTATAFMSRRCYETQGDTSGSPYRPWPMERHFWPSSAEYWTKQYPNQSAKGDEYEKEDVYLDEIETRMRKYDRKYRQSDKVKHLYNEFGYENQDDRAFFNYAGGLSGENDELAHGRGKKIDPAQYINADFTAVTRKPIPPVEFLTPEQVRRSRGSLASFRELPPETPSIWKYWNFYTTLGVVGALLVSKEYFILGGHDMFDSLMYWGVFGVMGAVIADWLAWWHAMVSQEVYDREYFMLNDKVQKINADIEVLATKPNERQVLMNLVAYRDSLSEKVLQRTLSNRVTRLLENANRKMSEKSSEEQGLKRDAENGWAKEAIDVTMAHFEKDKVKDDFMKEAIKQFCAPNAASLKQQSSTVFMASNEFETHYNKSRTEAKNKYMKEQKAGGTLSWVFVDPKERGKQQMAKKDKETEFTKRVKAWEQTHNPANVQMPAFA